MPSNLPLTNERRVKASVSSGNRGLIFDKFFDSWARDYDDRQRESKLKWANNFGGTVTVGDAAERIKGLCSALNGKKEIFNLQGPFVTGMGLSNPIENGFLWHHSTGHPYLPGSSIKGMIWAWASEWCGADNDEIYRIFGRAASSDESGSAGSVIVFDAFPLGDVSLYTEILTPHDGGWRLTNEPEKNPPGDWISPVPIPFLAVKSGAKFQFAIAARKPKFESDVPIAFEYMTEALDWIGAGAKTAIGFGRFTAQSAEPLAIGDAVQVTGGIYAGRFGRIAKIFINANSAVVSPRDGEDKMSKAINMNELKRDTS